MTIKNLENIFINELNLPKDAATWLCELYHVTQFFDDVADGDYNDRRHLDASLWCSLVSMPVNTFHTRYSAVLGGAVATMILKWQASDAAEKDGRHCEKSYVWRAGYYEIILLCYALVHGQARATEAAETILRLYGESFQQYNAEFSNKGVISA